MTVGDKIRNLRLSNGITAKFVALKAGISQPTLSKIERNKQSVTVELIPIFAEIFNVDIKYFFEEKVGVMPIKSKKQSA
ncbi:helix-turn-helix domain-containing protein [Brevibacillus laterosporus]|uniref:helix-turn-helix domain-containing protein n=1 Tax=Brevibacillus laterosporus TaxID=1465 RepID=UPI0018CF7BF0|nr:helix-turn-helix transcriptional regulator [Brevibacillus laterosporus]